MDVINFLGMYGGYRFYFDPTYFLVIIGVILCLAASARVRSTYAKYSQVRNYSGVTGVQAAERILHTAGIYDVRIEQVAGNLTDHYNPKTKVLRLSDGVYNSNSVASVGIAAHECGHAIQHNLGYAPLKLRSALVPVANFGSAIAWPLILVGIILGGSGSSVLITIGIILFSCAVLFQIVTLPVEFNASSRAMQSLSNCGILGTNELGQAKKVLSAAALTYVAGAASAVLQLLRLIMIAGRRRDN